MNHEIRQEGRVTVIALNGDLDVSSAPLLRDLLQQLIDEGQNQFLLDLSGVGLQEDAQRRGHGEAPQPPGSGAQGFLAHANR
jgi:hypothetical protein